MYCYQNNTKFCCQNKRYYQEKILFFQCVFFDIFNYIRIDSWDTFEVNLRNNISIIGSIIHYLMDTSDKQTYRFRKNFQSSSKKFNKNLTTNSIHDLSDDIKIN